MNFDWGNEVMLVTGGSSGLGKALGLEAGKLGATVILLARSKGRLEEVSKEINGSSPGSAFCFPFDLQNIEQIPGLYKTIVEEVRKTPTILINNVGYQVVGFVQNTPVEVYEENYMVNTLAPVALIQCVLPDMLRQERGVIANVYSSIMYHAFPGVSSYCASKKALQAIHESLKAELTGTPVKTLCIRPGAFRSNYWRNTDVGGRIEDFPYPSGEGLPDPVYVASEICKAIERGEEDFNSSTFKDKVGYHLSYWAPKLLDKVIVKRNSRLLATRPGIQDFK